MSTKPVVTLVRHWNTTYKEERTLSSVIPQRIKLIPTLCSIRIYRDLFSLGSMVQKGKFSAGAEAFVSTLKKVDFLHTDKIGTQISPHSTGGQWTRLC